MSLRRKSCDACFSRRRKCDLTYPTCKCCQKNKRTCHYAYAPLAVGSTTQSEADLNSTFTRPSLGIISSVEHINNQPSPSPNERPLPVEIVPDLSYDETTAIPEPSSSTLPSLLGSLGEMQPISGQDETWRWVIDQFKSFAGQFVWKLETVFIHKELYCKSMPQPLRAAFGILSAWTSMTEDNESTVFRILNAEAAELLEYSNGTMLHDLSKLQASVLYQIIRLFHSGLEQRALAEQQERSLTSMALQLLQRAREVSMDGFSNWHFWLLQESIRRTVLLSFLLHGMHSLFRHGVCLELPTLSALPISVNQTSWTSETAYLKHAGLDETTLYEDFCKRWLATSPRQLEPFEKLLLVACKGIDAVELLSNPNLFLA